MRNNNILDNVLVFDGAMGTMLLQKGLKPEYCPELMNIERSEVVKEVHSAYAEASADVLTTNTFGGNRVKLSEYGLDDKVKELNQKAVEIAKEAAFKANCLVAASVGPTGQFVEPMGKMTFQEAHEIFKEQIEALASEKPDFILLETFNDLGEIRAALLAARDVCDIPVICCLTYSGGRTLTGVTPASAAVVLGSLGAAAVGANCSGGPDELLPVIKEITQNTSLPVIVQPNAGLPKLVDGEIAYSLKPEEFIKKMEPYLDLGINILGSCCGSTPEYTRKLKNRLNGYVSPIRRVKKSSTLASRERVIRMGGDLLPKIVGERINPTARKKLAESLRNREFGIIQDEARAQITAGAHLLDVNVGIHGIDEAETMYNLVNLLQQNVETPLVIDSTKPEVIEKALMAYQGKALINSVNGEENSLKKVLPLAKRYGASIIGLTLDENGVPEKAEERYLIAEKIVKVCAEYGISQDDIYIDCLVLTVGTDDKAAVETLRTIKMVKGKLNVNTILGISNVSHGLPNRSKLNTAFLAMAVSNGLDMAIINPLDENMINTWQAASLLTGRDRKASNYISLNRMESSKKETQELDYEKASFETLKQLIIRGSQNALKTVDELVKQGTKPLEIMNKSLISGLNIVGDRFERGEYYLPQLMLSAEIAEKAFSILEKNMEDGTELANKKVTIVIGTVRGDVHDIGKNMVGVMLRTHGYKVIDLGKSVLPEEFVEAALRENAEFVGLSALMTTTMVEIPKTIKYIKSVLPDIKIIAGGAVVTEEFAREAGADSYSEDAVGAVKLVDRLRGR